MPGWMSSPTGETPPTSARGRKGGGRAHTSSFGDPSQPSWLNETTPRAAPSVTSWTATGEGDPLLPNKDTYVDIGLPRRHFKGPLGKRYSTDMLCFLLFGLYMVGMVALGIVAFVQDGLSDKAIYLTEGVDFQGHGCGSNGAVFYPHYQSHPDFGICVSECPNETSRVQVTLPVLASLSSNASNVIGATNMDAANATTSSTTVMRTVTFPGYATIKQGYVCAPVGALDAVVADTTQLNDVFGLYIGAIRENWEPLLYSAGTCLGLATLYLILLRFGGCFILGLSVVAFQAALVAAAVYIWSLSTNDTLDRHAQNILLIAAVFLVCGAMAYFLAVVVLVQRLLLAGKYLVFGTRVFSQMNKMVLIPFLYSFALVAALAWGLAVTVCLFTAGTTIDVPETIPVESTHAPVTVLVRSFERDSTLRWLFVYHAFGMYWLVSVLLALVDMTVAMAVAVWYFTPTDRQTKAKAFDVADPVQFSISTILKYHVGTAAFSALVVAPVRYIRNFFMYIDANKEVEAGGNWFSQLSSTLCCGKLIICSATSVIAWTMLVDKAALSDVVVPMSVIVLGSYAIAHTFMTLYETTINVLLLSFAMDESMNGGRNRAEFAQADFTKYVYTDSFCGGNMMVSLVGQ
ncbi:hypothetical protein DYB30_000764 [Aphanomyces astaci]|uniref:Choline transporter-like protein n=1 Tax=Aphanomyces astaci TaxID=112090 RepID=A0A397D2Y3_APHAT|nr:hypothetical protein DYB30_000764 [Aphanomyces astaci]